MVWVVTNEQPRFRHLSPGMVFTFTDTRAEPPDTVSLAGHWLRVEYTGGLPGSCNAVRLKDGRVHTFNDSDPVEVAYNARLVV